MKKGRIIVFEGLDCSFKETQSKLLYEHLMNKGENVIIHSFPTYSNESSLFVKEYLKGSYGTDPSQVGPDLATIFYLADMFHTWKIKLEQYYNEGYIIVLDRFWTSNLFHQLGKLFEQSQLVEENMEIINNGIMGLTDLATVTFKLPEPDCIFFMRMHYDIMLDLLKVKNSSNDIHENKKDYLKKVYNFFQLFNGNNYNLFDIMCNNPITNAPVPVLMQQDTMVTQTDLDKARTIRNTALIRSKEDIFQDILNVIEEHAILTRDNTKTEDVPPVKYLEDYNDTELMDMFTKAPLKEV